MYKYSFRLPPYYTLLVRSLSVLEGIALASDPNYKVRPNYNAAIRLMTCLWLVWLTPEVDRRASGGMLVAFV